MFGFWFNSRCPVDPPAKEWTEEQVSWLESEFPDWLHEHPIIEPTAKFFPEEFDRTPQSVRRMVDRICRYMGVEPRHVTLEMYSENRRPMLINDAGDLLGGTAGLYEDLGGACRIHLEADQLDDATLLVGTIAHELAHQRLLGESRIDPERFDNELLTDLTATYLGFGIFMANSPRDWKSQYSTWPGTDYVRPEYMNLPMYGYALGLIAKERFEESPPWAKHLNRDARSLFKQACRFLK